MTSNTFEVSYMQGIKFQFPTDGKCYTVESDGQLKLVEGDIEGMEWSIEDSGNVKFVIPNFPDGQQQPIYTFMKD